MAKKKKKTLRNLIIITVLLIVLAIIGKSAGFFGKKQSIKVSVEKAQKRTITETITANGNIQPETEVNISPDVSGEIVELNVIEGQEVKKGELLIRIKPDIYQSALERMSASLNSSKANLAQAEAQLVDKESNYNRMKKLWEDKTISDSEFEAAKSAYLVAKANVEAAKFSVESSEASLKEAKENLAKTNIYAPMNGTISKLNVEKGERVVGTAQMAGTELLRVANLNIMEVKVDVNENDIVRVNRNDTALIEIDAYMGKEFKGLVTEIANSANTSGVSADQVTNFEVKIRILRSSYEDLIPEDDPGFYPFRPGMSATVDIQTETVKDKLSIPIQAVTTRKDTAASDSLSDINDDIREAVFVYDKGKAYIRYIKTGIQDTKNIIVKEGLKGDEQVVTAPYSAISRKLRNKIAVERVKKDRLFTSK